MRFLFSMMALFLLGSMLYGLYMGVQTFLRGAARLTSSVHVKQTSPSAPQSPQGEQTTASQNFVVDLESLFALHQRGALTEEEFDRFKQHIFSSIAQSTTSINREKS